jgi:hypothetical protein
VRVKLRGLNQRGINRIGEHGEVFGLRRTSATSQMILVEALDGSNWFGWFKPDEVEIVEYIGITDPDQPSRDEIMESIYGK